MKTEEMKLLQAQNEALKKQCSSLQQEVRQWKDEYEVLDECFELAQGKIAELKAEKEKLIEGLGVANKYVNKYHQTLQEIKETAEQNIYLNPKLLEINGDIGQIQNISMTEILSLINQAEEE